eukprot:SAG22_NODE_86_length_21440_cov_288.248700_19_plen_105_part_00
MDDDELLRLENLENVDQVVAVVTAFEVDILHLAVQLELLRPLDALCGKDLLLLVLRGLPLLAGRRLALQPGQLLVVKVVFVVDQPCGINRQTGKQTDGQTDSMR